MDHSTRTCPRPSRFLPLSFQSEQLCRKETRDDGSPIGPELHGAELPILVRPRGGWDGDIQRGQGQSHSQGGSVERDVYQTWVGGLHWVLLDNMISDQNTETFCGTTHPGMFRELRNLCPYPRYQFQFHVNPSPQQRCL